MIVGEGPFLSERGMISATINKRRGIRKKEYLYTKLKEERIFQGKVYFDFYFSRRYLWMFILNAVPFSSDGPFIWCLL